MDPSGIYSLVGALAGSGGVFGAWLAWHRYREQKTQAQHTKDCQREHGQVERAIMAAVEGKDRRIHERIDGVRDDLGEMGREISQIKGYLEASPAFNGKFKQAVKEAVREELTR